MRKGAAKFVCSGKNVGPFIVDIFLKSGWKISRVKERYLKFETSGDQYCSSKINGQLSITVKFPFCLLSLRQRGRNSKRICRSFPGVISLTLHPQLKGLV